MTPVVDLSLLVRDSERHSPVPATVTVPSCVYLTSVEPCLINQPVSLLCSGNGGKGPAFPSGLSLASGNDSLRPRNGTKSRNLLTYIPVNFIGNIIQRWTLGIDSGGQGSGSLMLLLLSCKPLYPMALTLVILSRVHTGMLGNKWLSVYNFQETICVLSTEMELGHAYISSLVM